MAVPAVVVVGCCRKSRWSAAAAGTVKLLGVGAGRAAGGGPVVVAAAGVWCRLPKVARPPTALTVVVLVPVKAPGPVALTETLAVLAVRLPNWSRICTVTAGLMARPAVVVVGCCMNARWSAAAAVTLKLLEL